MSPVIFIFFFLFQMHTGNLDVLQVSQRPIPPQTPLQHVWSKVICKERCRYITNIYCIIMYTFVFLLMLQIPGQWPGNSEEP